MTASPPERPHRARGPMMLEPLLVLGGLLVGYHRRVDRMGGGALMTPMLVFFAGIDPLTVRLGARGGRGGRDRGGRVVARHPREAGAVGHGRIQSFRDVPDVTGRNAPVT